MANQGDRGKRMIIDQADQRRGQADPRELSAQLQRLFWALLEENAAVLDGESVAWKYVPGIVRDAVGMILLDINAALITYDAKTELPSARHHVEGLKASIEMIAAMLSADAPKC